LAHDSHKVSASKLVLSLLRGERKETAIILLYGLGVGLLSLAIPVGVQTLVSNVNFGSLSQPILFLVVAVFLGLGVAAFLRAIQVVIVEQLQKRFFTQVALELSCRIPRFNLEEGQKGKFPELVNRFFDVLTVQKSSAMLLLEGFALALQISLGLVLLAFYHWFLLAFALVMVVVIGIILFVLGRGAVDTSIEESIQKYRVAAWLEELAARPLLFRSAAARTMALERANEIINDYLTSRSLHFRILMRQVVGSLTLQAVASSALLGLGALLVIKNQLTLGQLVAAEIVVTTALGSLAKFQKHLEAFYDLIAALDKLELLLQQPMEKSDGVPLPKLTKPAEVEVQGLVYAYGKQTPLFNELSCRIPAGSSVAILGSNASGKSTLVDLLYGIKTAQRGTLLIEGQDYRDLSFDSIREQVALVRGLEMLPGSIFENVQMGREHISLEQVRLALSKLNLLDEVTRLADGIQTQLGGEGRPLSIAQAHRLVIARAICSSPRLILVDETLDDLDEHSRETALQVLLDKSAPWTLVLTTHDLKVASRCESTISLDSIKDRRSA